MTKEIIVNAGELESRVAILENGRLMELHVEREPKIVGNIYKGRVTKVLKGMDAAFVDIGIELNAFLSVSDVVSQEEDDEGGGGNGRFNRRELPPITQLLHANQEMLVQVVRAPMGTKGARITTRLSIPGRYMVLMLNSGSYIGVSRKIEDPRERQRLRQLANAIRPEKYSIIVRTEAEGKSESDLTQDLEFLLEMARRIETKADQVKAPALVHGDLNLILRLIRDAFTRDINRVVVDAPDAFENVMELVEMIAPHLKHRVFLYEEPMPIFHAYNIELEIEKTLRRKVWLPSGGSLVVDQAEALTAIDVNTGRFVGSVELAETVLTTNLQAAEEVARQLRLRDLGGIIVVDFIDMDNPKHRLQVTKAFEEALKRDRAKIKVHSISALGLVEMTRKRTGESLAGLLTEPCPYCSGIGRIQNALTVALYLQRELAAHAVEHPEAEVFSIIAHPRVVASVLGYEGEVHHDLEAYVGHPVYLRGAEDYHPNTFHLEHLTLEQALVAVPGLEEGEVVEGRVVNPDPALSLSPLVMARGMFLVVPDLDAPVGARVKVRVTRVGTSLAFAEPLAAEQRGIRTEAMVHPLQRPTLVPFEVLPTYLREEFATTPPRGQHLLSPTAAAVPQRLPAEAESIVPPTLPETVFERQRHKRRRRRGQEEAAVEETLAVGVPVTDVEATPFSVDDAAETPETEVMETSEEQAVSGETVARRRRRRRRRKSGSVAQVDETTETAALPETETEVETSEAVSEAVVTDESAPEAAEPERTTRRRRRGGRRTKRDANAVQAIEESLFEQEPAEELIAPEVVAQALLTLIEGGIADEEAAEDPAARAEEAVEAAETVAVPTEEAVVVEEAPVVAVATITEESPAETSATEVIEVVGHRRRGTRGARRTRRTRTVETTEQLGETAPEAVAETALAPADIMPEAPTMEAISAAQVEETPITAADAVPAPMVEDSANAPAAEEPVPAPRKRRATTTRRKKTPSTAEDSPTPDETPGV